ncbi:MAG: hypothetical protein Q9159_004800 [Coniocarpon cinnabarinum]
MASKQPNIDLYTTGTPNGIKISITLEELGIPYKTHKIDISKNTQKEPWFLEINPNGRIPAMTDTFDDGKSIRLFESGSMMQYLVATYDKDFKISFPPGTREYYEMNNWLFFLNAGVGPMQGQANHFTRYAPEPIEYGINRYQNETRRLYGVLENHLKSTKQDYLVGNKCTIADIAHWGWIAASGWAGVDIAEFPVLRAWLDRMAARPGVAKGKDVPDPYKLADLLKDPQKVKEVMEKSRAWIQQGMKEDAKKQS